MALKYKGYHVADDDASKEEHKRKLEKRATRQGGNFKGIVSDDCRTFKPQKGENFVRLMPPTWDGADHYGIDVWVHYSVGPEKATVLCLNQMQRKQCPVCQAKVRADRDRDEELAKQLSPRQQTLVWMVDLKEKGKGPLVWALAFTVEREIAKLSKDRQTGELYLLDHPEDGYNISFDREGEALHTKYSGWQISKRTSAVEPAWLDYVVEHPLPDVLVWRDYDEVKALFEGGIPDEPVDDQPLRPKTGSGGAGAKPDPDEVIQELRRRTKVEPKPEAEPDPPEDPKPEMAEASAGPATSSAKSKADALRERFKR